MLTMFPKPKDNDPERAVWFDLLDPNESEIAEVERQIGVPLPRGDALSEIERSSRLQRKDGVLTMSTPTAAHRSPDSAAAAPLGFVLSSGWLVTIRFTPLATFDNVISRLEPTMTIPGGGPEVFTQLCEEIVDGIADSLEHLAAELGSLSVATFHEDDGKSDHAVRSNRMLRAQLRQVGRLGDRLSERRDGLLGLGRILAFAEQFGCTGTASDIKARLASARQDLASLADYNEHSTNKVQFVLDAQVGLIGIAQNDIFKVLTIASIVGVPPTLIAGIYGMNFKNMPEYTWTYGYAYGLTVIALSGLLPLIWFKVKGWF